jgi:uncharacterized membrane protein YcaP (DUF421 family)
MDFARITVRVFFAYIAVLALTRASGKRSVAQGTPLDFVLALIIGDLFDNLFWGEVSASTLVAAAGTLTSVHVALSALVAKSARIRALLKGVPTVVLTSGETIRSGQASERLSEGDIEMLQRSSSVEDSREVKALYIEPSGGAGIILHDWAREAQRRDLPRVKAAVK